MAASQAHSYVAVATGAGNTIVSNRPVRLIRVAVITVGGGTGSVQFFNNATTNSGDVVFAIPATSSAAIGNLYEVDVWLPTGLVVQNVASGPALMVYVANL